jgi:hypothetical protein
MPCMPRQPTTGSVLSLVLLLDMSPTYATESSSAASTQFFADNSSLRPGKAARHSLCHSHSDSREGAFSRSFPVRFRCNLSIRWLPCRSRPELLPAYGSFYFRASNGQVTPIHCRISLRWQLSNSIGRTFICWTTKLASLHLSLPPLKSQSILQTIHVYIPQSWYVYM